jgi:uncharacterized OsmC-like protein
MSHGCGGKLAWLIHLAILSVSTTPVKTALIPPGESNPDRAPEEARERSAACLQSAGENLSMNTEDLRPLQAPLKERYRNAPDAARITLRAHGHLNEGVSCKIETGKGQVVAGLHPAVGGNGYGACSGDMLLEALVACAGVTLNAVATALKIELRDASIWAEGDLDFRGTLGVSKEVPIGFQNVRLHFALDTDASEEQLSTLLNLTERYCVVYQTLVQPPTLTTSHKRTTS